jgi:Domain of unknown function (DUF4864)
MKNILFLVLFVFSIVSPVKAETLSAADKSKVVSVITQQLQAFAVDDANTAYSFAAPIVQGAFPSIDMFMAMVKQGYQPVYRNAGYNFAESFADAVGRPAQRVIIKGVDGKTYEAIYTMQQQSDGTWKIAGCQILVLPGFNA